tara:strand:+ start:37 stop:153 length:117 start_codon:yes stop_codon:yes gene_type:complete
MGTEATRLNSGIQGYLENYLEFVHRFIGKFLFDMWKNK